MADKYTLEDIEREWNPVNNQSENRPQYTLEDIEREYYQDSSSLNNQTDRPIALDRNYSRQTFANLDNSTYQAIKNTVMPIWQTLSSPVETSESLVDFAESMTYLTFIPGTQTEKEEIAKGFVDYYKERLGGIENIKKTFRDDPVGFVLDLSLVGSLGSTVLKESGKQLGKSLNKNTKPSESRKKAQEIFTKSGDALQSASDFINPIIQTTRLASTVPSFLKSTATSTLSALTQKPMAQAYDIGRKTKVFQSEPYASFIRGIKNAEEGSVTLSKAKDLYQKRIKEKNLEIGKLKPSQEYDIGFGKVTPKTINMDEVLDVWADIKQNPTRPQPLSQKDIITGEIIPSPLLNNPAVKRIDNLLERTSKKSGLQDWQNISQLRTQINDVFKESQVNIPGAEFGPLNSAVSELSKTLKNQIKTINPKFSEWKAAQQQKINFQQRVQTDLGLEPYVQLKTDKQVFDKLKSGIGTEASDIDFRTLGEIDPSDKIRATILGSKFSDDIPVIKGATGSIQRQVMSAPGRASLLLSVPQTGAGFLARAGRYRNYLDIPFQRRTGRGLLGSNVLGREMERQEDENF
tara:strand:- start:1335 stop:3062 length:1728 start_codon:yes stop_codon:yes gene_type:complete